ncbi:MAG: S41 family peptidase [Bacillota bacterium]
MNKRRLKLGLIVILILSLIAIPVIAEETASEIGEKIYSFIQIIKEVYYKDVDSDKLVEAAIKGMFQSLDPHSEYYNQKEYSEFIADVSGEFGGVGIVVEKKDHITVVAPIEGTPGERHGFKPGDEIIFVDDTDISDYSLEAAVDLIRGEPGTTVRLGIMRKGSAEIIYIDVVREIIKVNPVKFEIKEDNIGYIRISQFNEQSFTKFKEALEHMNENNVKGIIIDVRNNPGGFLDEVTNICKQLIPAGPIVHIDYKDSRETISAALPKAPYKIVVLMNEGSASASEILAGAVKDSGTGILVGEKTYGKGTVQSIFPLFGAGAGGIKVTTAQYLTPSEYALDGKGIEPDVKVSAETPDYIEKNYSPIKADRNLKSVTVGLDVQGAQQRLQKLGYEIKEADGIYKYDTRLVVMQFEKDNKLTVDGILEPEEQQELIRLFDEAMAKEDVQLDAAMEEMRKLLNE